MINISFFLYLVVLNKWSQLSFLPSDYIILTNMKNIAEILKSITDDLYSD